MITLTCSLVFAGLALILSLYDSIIYQEPLMKSFWSIVLMRGSHGNSYLLIQLMAAFVTSIAMDFRSLKHKKIGKPQ